MDELCVQRRLVKSPPELWAELSDLEALSRHLDHFGEIRISRLEPESTVAWEGERASGTVVLDPAGWGTKVTLTAEMHEPAAPADAADAAAAETVDGSAPAAQPQEETAGDTTPVAADEQAGGPAADPLPAAPLPRPEPSGARSAAPSRRRPGFFARLFGRRHAAAEAPAPPAAEPRPEAVLPPAPPPVAPDPVLVAALVEPLAAPPVDTGAAATALEQVLDTLGAAHHRPFSR